MYIDYRVEHVLFLLSYMKKKQVHLPYNLGARPIFDENVV